MDAETTVGGRPATAPAAEPAAPTRRAWIANTGTQRILAGVVVIVLLVAAFYGGREYQNTIDQKLFNDYNPPATGAGRAGLGGAGAGFAAGGTGQSSLVQAALGAGTPPGSTTRNGGGSSSAGATGASGSTGAAGTRVVGSVSAISPTSMSLQAFSGATQSVALTPQTRFYTTKTGTMQDIGLGDAVTIAAQGSGRNLTAASITIGAAGVTGAGGGFGGRGGFGGAGLTTVRGTVSSLAATSLTVSGSTATIAVSSTTRISKLVSVPSSQIKSGSFVTASLGSAGGKQVALTVVERSSFRGGGFPGGGSFSGPGG